MSRFPLSVHWKKGTGNGSSYGLLAYIIITLLVFSLFAACSSESTNDPSSDAVTPEGTSSIQEMEISATPEAVSLNGNSTIIASIYDSEQNPVSSGVEVYFSSSMPGTTITSSAATNQQGRALATFTAGDVTGFTTITVTCDTIERELFIQIEPLSSAGSIEYISSGQKMLGVKGSGLTETVELSFIVKDTLGNPVEDGIEVRFSLLGVSGDEYLSYDYDYTYNGLVSAFLNSGRVSGTVAVVARVELDDILLETTSRELAIHSGLPDAEHFTISASELNLAGLVWNGLTTDISVRLADQFGNPVPEGTLVYFTTESGSITAIAWTDATGLAKATLTSFNPRPIDGFVTIMAYTVGQESYTDNNSDGVYDDGVDTFWVLYQDMPEPYRDDNGNGAYDVGELFWDEVTLFPNENQWDSGNAEWDERIFVWGDIEILFSGYSQIWIYDEDPNIWEFGRGNIPVSPTPLATTTDPSGTPTVTINVTDYFYIVVADSLGNPLTKETSITFELAEAEYDPNTTSCFEIIGNTSDEIKTDNPYFAKRLFTVQVHDTSSGSQTCKAKLNIEVTSDDRNMANELSIFLEN